MFMVKGTMRIRNNKVEPIPLTDINVTNVGGNHNGSHIENDDKRASSKAAVSEVQETGI